MDKAAREGAKATWGYRECGIIPGVYSNHLEKFMAVEENRYRVYPWLKSLLNRIAWKDRVLEIGPGMGTDLVQFARNECVCYGVDITEAHLRSTAQNFGARGLQPPTLWQMDAVDMDQGIGDKFDLVFSNGVIHHIPEDYWVVEAAHNVLRPGGRFVFLVYNTFSWFRLYKLLRGQPLWSVEEGADGVSRKPYVRTYTYGDIKKLLGGLFRIERHTTECCSPLPDWVGFGGWFHVVEAVKR